MTDNVTKMYPSNAANNIDNVLEQAVGQFNDAIIIGWNKDGVLEARANAGFVPAQVNYALDLFKFKMLRGDYRRD